MKLRPKPSQQPPSLVNVPYPELAPDRNLESVVFDAIDPRNRTLNTGAHFNCGSTAITRFLGTWPSGRWHGIEPHVELAARAKAVPFGSQNFSMAAIIRSENLDLLRTHPLRRDYAFRQEPLHQTSIRAQSVDCIVVEIGHRGQIDDRALADEIRRIGLPGAIVIVIIYDELRIDEWQLDDPLHRELFALRRRMRRSRQALKVFDLRQVARGRALYATGCFDLPQVMRHIDESPECQRLKRGWDWTATQYLFRELRKNWKRGKRNVRRRARVFVGKVPAASTEPQEQA
ncbi:hypothetical protein [Candidatus Viadribacter manganicus]|uniref:Methyltransferase type 11 domain-containing protein n=1 Tax=Candidatus Viadribacter manganicus TaxID=1759059 RepID=A0A1B1AHN9_9PROT|nr:hypothetical protein [Candidatus Viadribacter manganicus]ANP46050.1 hypothetical protein ATE48_09010 [Candidatus Viadribacter manganicus]